MKEDEVELIDYFRVIWKRKILIIVVTLVCMVAGAVMSLRLPVTYRAEVIIRVGKIASSNFASPAFVPLDSIDNLVKTISIEYAPEGEALGYDLDVEVVKKTTFIRIALEGPDERRTKDLLNEVVERLKVDHHRRSESAVHLYNAILEKLETDIIEIQNDLDRDALELIEVDKKMNKLIDREINILTDREDYILSEKEDYILTDKEMEQEMDLEVVISELNPLSLLIQNNRVRTKETALNRSMAIQNNISRMQESAKSGMFRIKQMIKSDRKYGRSTIRSIQSDIFLHQSIINSFYENKTKLVGGMVEICVKPKTGRNTVLAGVVGFVMSLCLAFFVAFLEDAREKKNDSVSKKISTGR